MNSFIKKMSDGVYKVERPVLGVLIAAVVVLLFVNVILRYAFNAPLAWAD
jgi:TRAP-type C4-dicarboxylate transport system permease small subunit